MSRDVTPEIAVDIAASVGEGPLWHPDENALYWCDIPDGELYRYEPDTGENLLVHEDPDEPIGGFTIQDDGTLLLFQDAGAVRRFDPSDSRITTVVEADPDRFHERFNDVVADAAGRVFAGVMSDVDRGRPGQLYRLDLDGSFELVRDECIVPNGMGFSPDCDRFYFTDTGEIDPTNHGYIYRYRYDRSTGAIADPEVFLDASAIAGLPDGMTVDDEGHVWSAFWNGHKLMRFAPDGTHERTVRFHPRKISSVTFGSEEYATAYVTTACPEEREREGEHAGSLFTVDLGVRGREEFCSRIAT